MDAQGSINLLDDFFFKSPIDPTKQITQYQTLSNLTLLKPLNNNKSTLVDPSIKYVRFKVKKNVWQERARSNSPKGEEGNEKRATDGERKETQKLETKESAKKSDLNKELNYLSKNNIFNRKGFELCFQIFEQIFRGCLQEEHIATLENVKQYFEKMIFLNEKTILKKVESSLNKNMVFLQGLLCREIVSELCDKRSEDREMYLQKIRSIENEKNKVAASLEAKTTEKMKTDIMNDSLKQSRIDFLQQESEALKEKVKNMEIYVQKLSTENSKIKEGFQSKIEIISMESEETSKNYERTIAELRENIEKLKNESIEKETEIQNLKSIHDKVINDYKKMISTMRGTKEKIAKLEEKISNLTKEKQDLTVRAAVPFEELTPRPSFIKFKEIFELSEAFFQNKTTKEMTDELFKVCKNYILTDVSEHLSNATKQRKKSKGDPKNECFSSFMSIKSSIDGFNQGISRCKSNNLLEIPGHPLEFDEIIQEKAHKPNLNLKVIIPDRITIKTNEQKEPLTAGLSPKEKKNGYKMNRKVRRKCHSP